MLKFNHLKRRAIVFLQNKREVGGIADATSHFALRPYQEACINACTDALKAGCRRFGVSLPTGSGKTTVFISLLAQIKAPNHEARHSMIIVNSVELAYQAASQVRRLLPEASVEIEQGTDHQASGRADVTIATYQTLSRPQRLAKFNPQLFKVVIVDEAHHAAAVSYRRILSHFEPAVASTELCSESTASSNTAIIGFSATFSRYDGLALGSVFERIVYHRDLRDMITEQWLCNMKYTTVKARIGLSGVRVSTKSGDFNASSLAQVINTKALNSLVVQSWLDKAVTRKSTLVFCANLAHVRDLTREFRDAGIDARYVYSKSTVTERRKLIKEFREGYFPVLINCAILTEGADMPNTDCVVIARPTKSPNIFIQMLGRGMRLSSETDKVDCHVIDFMDSGYRSTDILSIPTLLGLPPDQLEGEYDGQAGLLEDSGVELDIDTYSERTEDTQDNNYGHLIDVLAPSHVTYIDYNNPFVFIDNHQGAPHITHMSAFAWVGCGDGVYVLECLRSGFVRINTTRREEEPVFEAHFTPMIQSVGSSTRFGQKRKVLSASSLTAAIRGCDTFVKTKIAVGDTFKQLFRTAKWRSSPASEAQKQFVSKCYKRGNHQIDTPKGSDSAKFDLDSLTKGQAANLITRLKHGAQGRHKKQVANASREAMSASKKLQLRDRWKVEVGPLPSGRK